MTQFFHAHLAGLLFSFQVPPSPPRPVGRQQAVWKRPARGGIGCLCSLPAGVCFPNLSGCNPQAFGESSCRGDGPPRISAPRSPNTAGRAPLTSRVLAGGAHHRGLEALSARSARTDLGPVEVDLPLRRRHTRSRPTFVFTEELFLCLPQWRQ